MSKRKAGTALPHHGPRFCVQQAGLELTGRRCRDCVWEALQVKGSLGLSKGQRTRPSMLCQGSAFSCTRAVRPEHSGDVPCWVLVGDAVQRQGDV